MQDNPFVIAVQLLFSGMVCLSTIVYAALTGILVWETRKMRQSQFEPSLSVYARSSEQAYGFIDIVLQNVGPGPAYDVQLKVDPDYEYLEGRYLSHLGVMNNGWRYLAPGQEILLCFTHFDDKKMHIKLDFTVQWKNNLGKSPKRVFIINFSEFRSMFLMNPPIMQVSRNLASIEKNIGHIGSYVQELQRKAVREQLLANTKIHPQDEESKE